MVTQNVKNGIIPLINPTAKIVEKSKKKNCVVNHHTKKMCVNKLCNKKNGQ